MKRKKNNDITFSVKNQNLVHGIPTSYYKLYKIIRNKIEKLVSDNVDIPNNIVTILYHHELQRQRLPNDFPLRRATRMLQANFILTRRSIQFKILRRYVAVESIKRCLLKCGNEKLSL